jgi:hypothetical protein
MHSILSPRANVDCRIAASWSKWHDDMCDEQRHDHGPRAHAARLPCDTHIRIADSKSGRDMCVSACLRLHVCMHVLAGFILGQLSGFISTHVRRGRSVYLYVRMYVRTCVPIHVCVCVGVSSNMSNTHIRAFIQARTCAVFSAASHTRAHK